ncbi:hypothetical protein HY948_04840 [Candidatus Gottesmanbacteria bacterium]|nr:hypothetical protein [Candidatus Gottesmanbacteria bacterium]
MKKQYFLYILLVFAAFLWTTTVRAEYVLPYPGSMPGSKFYLLSRIADSLKRYWYWGSIASLQYHLQLSDKYLVEAKTLFEYQQYVLAVDALTRSNEQFTVLPGLLHEIEKEGKNVSKLRQKISEASEKHLKTLDGIQTEVPAQYVWKPEKLEPVFLDFTKIFFEAKQKRIL